MTGGRTRTTLQLFVRSLLPSAISATIGFCISISIVGIHLVLLSLTAGTALPKLFDGEWGILYTNSVVQPLEAFTNNFVVNNALVVVAWGFAGLCLYVLGDFLVRQFSDWRSSEHDITMPTVGQIAYHPARRSVVTAIVWRATVLIIGISAFVAMQPLLQRALNIGPKIILGDVALRVAIWQISLAVLILTLLSHFFVVFLRLFLLRTRVLGDPEIE